MSPSFPLSHAVGARPSHPRRVCSSQPRTGTVGDRRGEGCCPPGAQGDGHPEWLWLPALPPCQVIEKVQSKAFSVPAGGLHVCPQEPGLPRGFAWKMRVVLFSSEQGSSTCARDFEMVQVRCRVWEVVMDGPGQEDGANNQRSPLALCIPFQHPLQLLHPNPPTPFMVLWFFGLVSLFLNPMEIKL